MAEFRDGPRAADAGRRKLDRATAIAHPRLSDFWAIVDFLLVEHPLIHAHVYGPVEPPQPGHP
ncbi:MAG: hypothetical protein KDA94_13840 [Acidimicrobiales bacterium]|nr:hypothetical protein [Acidimicrobiales bacterium]